MSARSRASFVARRAAGRRRATGRVFVALAAALSLSAAAGCHSTTVSGPAGESLTATTPRSMVIRRGESAPLLVGIQQERRTGPVSVAIDNLPRGVASDVTSQRVETTSATFILSASNSADLVASQAVKVTVASADGRSATQYVDLTVRE